MTMAVERQTANQAGQIQPSPQGRMEERGALTTRLLPRKYPMIARRVHGLAEAQGASSGGGGLFFSCGALGTGGSLAMMKMSHLSYPALVLAGVHRSVGVLKARQAVRVSRVVQGFASSSFMPRINHSRAGKASEKARMPQPAGIRLPRLRMSPSETQAGVPGVRGGNRVTPMSRCPGLASCVEESHMDFSPVFARKAAWMLIAARMIHKSSVMNRKRRHKATNPSEIKLLAKLHFCE